jgi:hypothetical protein
LHHKQNIALSVVRALFTVSNTAKIYQNTDTIIRNIHIANSHINNAFYKDTISKYDSEYFAHVHFAH